MNQPLPIILTLSTLALAAGGCVRPAALTRSARRIGAHFTPAGSAVAGATRRMVQFAGQAADDAALVMKVKAVLMVHKGLVGERIQVSAEEGVVRLAGQVSSPQAQREAGEAVRGTAGVSRVDNRLRLRH